MSLSEIGLGRTHIITVSLQTNHTYMYVYVVLRSGDSIRTQRERRCSQQWIGQPALRRRKWKVYDKKLENCRKRSKRYINVYIIHTLCPVRKSAYLFIQYLCIHQRTSLATTDGVPVISNEPQVQSPQPNSHQGEPIFAQQVTSHAH